MSTPAEEDALVVSGPSSRMRRTVGFVIGVLLFAAAIVAVITSRTALGQAFAALEHADWRLVVLGFVLPLANWHLISVSFWILTQRFGKVGLGEMHALIGSAWLLNYLPLRPGMFGRIAYHKRVNGIRVKDSVRVLVTSVSLTIVSNVSVCAIAWAAFRAPALLSWIIVAAPGVVVGAVGLVLAARATWPLAGAAGLTLALAVRYLDILAWVARYAVVFALMGYPLTLAEATLVTAVSQAALLIPFVGNGLGVREWGIGLAVPIVASESPRALGLAADLVNRAIEVVIAAPVGLIASAWLYRRTGRRFGSAGYQSQGDLESGSDPADAQFRTGP